MSHQVIVQGACPPGLPIVYPLPPPNGAVRPPPPQTTGAGAGWQTPPTPILLQMNDEDFPARFLADLSAGGPTPGSTVAKVETSPTPPSQTPPPPPPPTQPTPPAPMATLYQPVHRILPVALVQLACESVRYPRLDPTRVLSAGVVIRRIERQKGDLLHGIPWAWTRDAQGQFQWSPLDPLHEDDDPDPTQRPQLYSGQPALDRLLTLQSLAVARSEVYTPAFVAAPAVCAAAKRTLVYAVVPTASSDISTSKPTVPTYATSDLEGILPTLLQPRAHSVAMPHSDQLVDYQWMSDDYAIAQSAAAFTVFSTTLRMMATVFGAFDGTPPANSLIATLNKYNVHIGTTVDGFELPLSTSLPMGAFYQQAAKVLIDYDPNSGGPTPSMRMPRSWDATGEDVVDQIKALLQSRSTQVTAPTGRFQDATRLYRLRVFLRVKSDICGCPPKLVWSEYSDPFRIAAWHESADRTRAPVPLPDPFDPNFRNSAKPNCFFSVPPTLMNAMQGTKLSDLSSGKVSKSGGGVGLGWICGFSIPLITICAFFVLNIFLTLLNLVFFWLPIIKICIPIPVPQPSQQNDP
ncbi:MAG TPA: hypothetical protein VEK73_05340 [Xanthobacteraceae bacterium]|nr:hypothetical protein [Xanthobacteraceae bacterium]